MRKVLIMKVLIMSEHSMCRESLNPLASVIGIFDLFENGINSPRPNFKSVGPIGGKLRQQIPVTSIERKTSPNHQNILSKRYVS